MQKTDKLACFKRHVKTARTLATRVACCMIARELSTIDYNCGMSLVSFYGNFLSANVSMKCHCNIIIDHRIPNSETRYTCDENKVHLDMASSFQCTKSLTTVTDIWCWEGAMDAPLERPIVPLDSVDCGISMPSSSIFIICMNIWKKKAWS